GRDPIRVDDPGLDREHDPDGARNRDDPVESDPPAVRQIGEEAVDRIARTLPLSGGAVARRVVTRARGRIRENVVRVPELTPETVLPAALEGDSPVGGLD